MKEKTKQKNLERGITLIALVVTIIVLLILAGVTISALSGDNGILKRAIAAREVTEKEEFFENVDMAASEYYMDLELNNENAYDRLKEKLQKKGYTFVDETDGSILVSYKEWSKNIEKSYKDNINELAYYSNIELAWKDVNNHTTDNADLQSEENAICYISKSNKSNIYLMKDAIVNKKIEVSNDVIFNLNGKTLKFADDSGYGNEMSIDVLQGGKLTINDEENIGKIEKNVNSETVIDYIIATDGELYINGGNYILQGNSTKSLTGIVVGLSAIQDNSSKEGIYCEIKNANCKTINNGSDSGSAVQCVDEKANLKIASGKFEGNGVSGRGFGVRNFGTLEIQNGEFIGKSKESFGAGCWNYETATIEILNGTFYGSNEGNTCGGRGIANSGIATIRGGDFKGESSNSSGIGISNYSSGNMEIINCSSYGKGLGTISGVGVENDNKAILIIWNGEYIGESNSNASYGCRNTGNSTLTIKGGTFTGNSSGYACYNSSSTITLEGGTFNGKKYGC